MSSSNKNGAEAPAKPTKPKKAKKAVVVKPAFVKSPLAEGRVYGWHKGEKACPFPPRKTPQHHAMGANLPVSVDLEPFCPPVYDQGQLGSCTGNALAFLVQFLLMKLGLVAFVPSRLMIYFNERSMEGTKSTDSGADANDGLISLQAKGVCPETLWPYDISQFAVKPPSSAYGVATKTKVSDPVSIADGDLVGIKSSLAEGYPVVFGFQVYESFESEQVAQTGMVPMPVPLEQVIGGHEPAIVGYDDEGQVFKVRNSWGPDWGVGGYCYFPYAYIGNPQLAGEFRSATMVTGSKA